MPEDSKKKRPPGRPKKKQFPQPKAGTSGKRTIFKPMLRKSKPLSSPAKQAIKVAVKTEPELIQTVGRLRSQEVKVAPAAVNLKKKNVLTVKQTLLNSEAGGSLARKNYKHSLLTGGSLVRKGSKQNLLNSEAGGSLVRKNSERIPLQKQLIARVQPVMNNRKEDGQKVMPKKKIMDTRIQTRRSASKDALKQTHLTSSDAYDETETYEITSDEETVNADMPPKKKYRLSHRKSSDDRDVIVLKTIKNSEETLKLEVWPEELSQVQVAQRSQTEKELKEVNTRVDKVLKQSGAEIIYQGDVCSAYQVATPSTATFTTPAPPQNMVLQPSKTNNNQSAGYQLVMDPRLGFIVGTMTPTTATTIPTQTSATQNATTTVQSKLMTRKRGRPTSQTPTQQPAKQITPQPVQLRPTECSAVGGLSTGNTPPPKPVASSVVDLTTDDGRPAADSREISFNKLQGKTFPSLVVVARPHLRVKDTNGGDRSKLDAKVKTVLMHVPTKFTEWLIQQGLVRSEQNCIVHTGSKLKLGMYSDVSKFPFSGGYVWISECCPQRFVSVFSGSLFEGSPQPPTVILKLIYHWACQTNVQNVVQWVKVDNLYVKGMNTWLRALCTVALHTHIGPLGGPGRKVEVGVISLGTTSHDGQQRQVKVEVLGLLESDAKLIRLRAVEPLVDGDKNYKKRFSKILEPLVQWVHPESIIVTDLTVDKATLNGMGFVHVQQSTATDHTSSNHTIMEYLRRIVPRMFQNTLSLLSRQIIQQFLDELVWREWYGPTASQAFDNMVIHLSEQTRADTGSSLILRLNKVAANPFKNWSVGVVSQVVNKTITEPTLPVASKRVSNRQKKLIEPTPAVELIRPAKAHSPDIPEQLVPLENYYYGTIEGDDGDGIKMQLHLRCSMCKSTFSNNIRLMTHLFTHAHNVTGATQQCHYCLSSVATAEGLQKHINTSHPCETRFSSGYACVICEVRFTNPFTLGKHLSREHAPAELPYECGTCGHRCSSHKHAIDHFYTAHDGGVTIQCPFCLKSTSLWSTGRFMPQNLTYFLQHLQKHQKKNLAKKCPKCALWFINKDTLKDHQNKMHLTMRRRMGLIPWTSPRHGLMVPKSKQDQPVAEEEDFDASKLKFDFQGKYLCKECKLNFITVKHFPSSESCPNCQYSTFCRTALGNHGKICKDLNASLPVHNLPYAMYCVCGYSDHDGNTLAKHLAECEKKSAYPSVQAAKAAIVTHSMLNVLGLVRRPEESLNTVELTEKDSAEGDSSDVVIKVDVDEVTASGDENPLENDEAEFVEVESEKSLKETEEEKTVEAEKEKPVEEVEEKTAEKEKVMEEEKEKIAEDEEKIAEVEKNDEAEEKTAAEPEDDKPTEVEEEKSTDREEEKLIEIEEKSSETEDEKPSETKDEKPSETEDEKPSETEEEKLLETEEKKILEMEDAETTAKLEEEKSPIKTEEEKTAIETEEKKVEAEVVPVEAEAVVEKMDVDGEKEVEKDNDSVDESKVDSVQEVEDEVVSNEMETDD